MQEPILLTESETAKRLNVCPRTIYTLAQTGKLRRTRIGRSVRYHIRDIEAFLERAVAS